MRHKFLDIEVIVKRTLVFAGMFSFVFGLFISVAYLIGQFFGGGRLLSLAITSLIVVFTQRPIENFLRNATDKFLFQKRYAYERILREASEGMRTARTLKTLINTIVKYMLKYVRPDHIAILLLNKKAKRYSVIASRPKKTLTDKAEIRIDSSSPLIKYFEERRLPLLKDELARIAGQDDRSNALLAQFERLRSTAFIPSICKDRLVGILALGDKLSGEPYAQKDLDLFLSLANQAGSTIDDFLIEREKEDLFFDTMMLTVSFMEMKNPYTAGHVEVTSSMADMVAGELQNEPPFNKVEGLAAKARFAGLLHDLGKLLVADDILNKPGKLTPEEWKEIKEHPRRGVEIIGRIRAMDEDILDAIMYHQEKWDGTGYPYGLKGADIPPIARITAVVDAFHAMTSNRPYKKGMAIPEAMEEIRRCSGTQFDPAVVKALVGLYERRVLDKLYNKNKDDVKNERGHS